MKPHRFAVCKLDRISRYAPNKFAFDARERFRQINIFVKFGKIHADFEVDAPNWTTFDCLNFSRRKRLWDYQQNALNGAMKALWKYYEDYRDYQPNEADNYDDISKNANELRKGKLWACYEDNGLSENLNYTFDAKNAKILGEYFPVAEKGADFRHFINRMSFWMATGSGNSLQSFHLISLKKFYAKYTRTEVF